MVGGTSARGETVSRIPSRSPARYHEWLSGHKPATRVETAHDKKAVCRDQLSEAMPSPGPSVYCVLRVWPASEVTEDLVRAVHHLLPQLSGSARLPSGLEIDQIVTSQATTLLLACDDGSGTDGDVDDGGERGARSVDLSAEEERAGAAGERYGPIVGMLTLVTFRLPTGVRAWIEDVVVDSGSRGQGVGEALTQAAIELATARGAQTVDLTSRPSREAANRLYRRMGFEPRETNVYRFRFPS